MTGPLQTLLTIPLFLIGILVSLAAAAAWRGRGSPLHRWRLHLGLAAGVIYVASIPVLPNAVVRWLEHRHPVPSVEQLRSLGIGHIVVLASGWIRPTTEGYEVKIGAEGWERTWTGVRLWRELGGVLVFSGLPAPNGAGSAAQEMAAVAREWGVPAAALRVETRSRNTYENLLFTRHSLGSTEEQRILLVTSAMHMARAFAVARHAGFAVVAYPCDFRAESRTGWRSWCPSGDTWGALREALHELAGIAVYRARDWL
jgi:uncharacterized SAM-binding protein YcdF (DUF218 family)